MLPNEAARKVYILDEAETMNPAAQNAALKLLEEPPAGAVFLLCTTNPLLLLPTVRSRCAHLSVGGGEQDAADEGVKALAAGYLKAVAAGDEAQLLRWCSQNEGVDAKTLAAFAQEVRLQLADMLCLRQRRKAHARGLMRPAARAGGRSRQYLKVNTGVKQLFGLLAVESIAGSGNRG